MIPTLCSLISRANYMKNAAVWTLN